MRRLSVLGVVVLALVLSGCFGGSADKASPGAPVSEAKTIGEADLDITLRESVGGMPARIWRFHVSCPHIEGDIVPSHLCKRITAPGSGFFGIPHDFTTPYGGTGNVRIRGTVNGVAVITSYRLGGAPQWGYWMRALFRRPLDPAVRYATGEVTNLQGRLTGVTNQRTIHLPCPSGALCVLGRTQHLVGGPWFVPIRP